MSDTTIGRRIKQRAREDWPRRARCLVVLSLCILLPCCGAARRAIEKEAGPATETATEPATETTTAPVPAPAPETAPVAETAPAAETVNLSGALAGCRSAFPDQIAQAVARASCVIKATDLVRPLLPFPELLDRENALRKALAEQVQARAMSLLERNVQIQKLHSQLLDEERSRLPAAQADASRPPPPVSQWRQSNSESCGRLGGDSANCF
ncbi:hypothetical protein [Bradyrhizobium quebecense]|uniref:Uncharacterized protein n=2 Tax=Bradyrhizobium quebecense TaxID=2748629 RepID=A0A973WPK0_9BRAD|nr:hypothetical protein [Bradyrhizobium quebecense]UGA45872.1 hypothetical protein HU230_0007485 [Bradyrhizobium quebecense]UGY02103.1 hypothetical protein J4P68_0034180 [Bradyrhizobium quebecense]